MNVVVCVRVIDVLIQMNFLVLNILCTFYIQYDISLNE